jgi:hypothetical protein
MSPDELAAHCAAVASRDQVDTAAYEHAGHLATLHNAYLDVGLPAHLADLLVRDLQASMLHGRWVAITRTYTVDEVGD